MSKLFKIKPLDFQEEVGVWKAATPVGYCYVTETSDGWKWYCDFPGFQSGWANSLANGKELAEADWQARIMLGLEEVDVPDPDIRIIEERDAAEEAMGKAYELLTGHPAEWSNNFGYAEALEEMATVKHSLTVQPEPDRELLDALKGVIRIADRDTVEFAAARAAVAKAEGV